MSTEDQSAPRGPRNGRVRASDAEREKVAETLRAAVTDGRLDLEEGDQRLATLYATKFRDELPPLIADLPKADDEQPRGDFAGWGPGRHGPWGGPGRQTYWGYGRPPWPWRLVPLVAIIAIVGGIVSLAHGFFFWPIIPLLFLFGAFRLGICAGWRRFARSDRTTRSDR